MKAAVMSVDEYRNLLGVPRGYRAVKASLNDQFIEVFFEPVNDPWQEVVRPLEYHHPVNPRADNVENTA